MKWYCKLCDETITAFGFGQMSKVIQDHVTSEKHLSKQKGIVFS